MAELTVTRLSHRGDGIAPGPVYVPQTLPGETVAGEVIEGRVTGAKILVPSPERVRPPCRHAKTCGGCQMLHASDAFMATWKQAVVAEALAAQGLPAPIAGIDTSPPNSRRRATLAGRRLRTGPVVGFHGLRSDQVTAIPDCRILTPALTDCLARLQAITQRFGARRTALGFALTDTETGVDCTVTGGGDLTREMAVELPALAQGLARLTWGTEPVFTARRPTLQMGGATIAPPPGAFLQATKEGETALVRAVTAATEGARHIVDLFAGLGTFALPLSQGAHVHAVEGLADMTHALDQAARQAMRPQVTVETRDLFRRPLLPDELARFDAAVIDPPRAGAQAQIAQIAAAQVPRLAMVSCNPATFARDSKTLTDAGYVLDWIRVVDQFRWSAHVELAAALRLPHMPPQEAPQ